MSNLISRCAIINCTSNTSSEYSLSVMYTTGYKCFTSHLTALPSSNLNEIFQKFLKACNINMHPDLDNLERYLNRLDTDMSKLLKDREKFKKQLSSLAETVVQN